MVRTRYEVFYKTGGTENYKWHEIFEFYPTLELAMEKRNELLRMGYEAIITNNVF
jgi:hypothetical protein